MNVQPGAEFTWTPIETGTTGLVGTLAVAIYDGDTAETALTASGVNEISTSGIYEAVLTAPDDAGTYTLIASLDGSLDADQLLTDLLTVTANAPFDPPTGDTYADADELARILKIRSPSTEQTAAMNRMLLVATGEIDSEIDLDDDTDLAGWQLALAAEVCLRRAAELWALEEVRFNLVGLGSEFGPSHISNNTWGKYANDLAPLKGQWGLA